MLERKYNYQIVKKSQYGQSKSQIKYTLDKND